MEHRFSTSFVGEFRELLTQTVLALLLILGLMIIYTIWHYRNKKMREYRRKREASMSKLGEKLDLKILPGMSKDDLRQFAVATKEEMEEGIDVKIDLENYEGLPLKPKVYFSEEDVGADEPIKPTIKRSFLSNEPLPDDLQSGE